MQILLQTTLVSVTLISSVTCIIANNATIYAANVKVPTVMNVLRVAVQLY